ncbi:MAG: SMI1/KNR4 family protein [Hymenobacter sp.]|nr:MAG: SMI1/KNR4 family protein [Hymenobacter sp.]
MNTQDWQNLLVKTNELVLQEDSFQGISFITKEQRAAGWVGKPGASEAEIERLERCLSCKLPASYRIFLATSNGFGPISTFIYDLYSTAEVDWLVTKEPELVEMWEEYPESIDSPWLADAEYLKYDGTDSTGSMKPGHMRQCLMISNWGDAGFLALNPAQQHEGEWETWHFANWIPGVHRYRSFAEFMQSSYQEYRELRQEKE